MESEAIGWERTRLTRVIVVYESKYGNTKIVAERISEGLDAGKGVKVDLRSLKEVDVNKIPEYDAILIGSPNHMGGPTRGIKKFIDKLGKLDLKNKQTATFDTYISRDFEKAVKKMEKSLTEKVPGLTIVFPGLSIRVLGMKGPIDEKDLLKCKEFGIKILAKIS
jgi:flavorubredoxin